MNDEIETIHAPKLTQDIEKMIAVMRMLNMQIAVNKNGETYLLDAGKILYVEAVDRKTFVYTEEEMYESELKLYEIEREFQKLMTDIFIKDMSVIKRSVLLYSLAFATAVVFSIVFKWFPINSIESWLGFIVCYSVAVYKSTSIS